VKLAHVSRVLDGSFVTASTSYVDLPGVRADITVPPEPYTVRATAPLISIEETGQQALFRLVQIDSAGTTVNVASDRTRSDVAGDTCSLLMSADVPAHNLAPTVGTRVTYKLQVATSVATSDVTIWSGDFFGEFLRPEIVVETARDGADLPRASIRRGYTGTSDIVVYEGTVTRDVPVVMIHGGGAGESGSFQFQDQRFSKITYGLAQAGFRVFEPALPTSPVAGCGNAAAVTALTNLRSWLITNYGYRSNVRVGYVGLSVGMVEALVWSWNNPTLFAGIAGVVGATDLDSLHDRNALGVMAANIEAAYGGLAAWDAAKPTRDPHVNAALIRPLGDRIRIWFSTDDPVVLPAETRADVDAWGAQSTAFGSAGHGVGAWEPDDLVIWANNTFRN